MASPNTIDSDLYGITIGNSAIRALQAALLPLTRFSTNFSGEMGRKNQSIVVPLHAVPTSSADKAEGVAYTRQGTVVSETTVTLNKHKYVSWELTDNEANASNIDSLEKLGVEKAQALAIDISDDILSIVTAANFGAAAFTGAASTFDHDDVIDLQTVADTAFWSPFNRSAVLSPAYYNALFKDTVTGADVYGSALVAQGKIPMLAEFEMHKHLSIPANAENLVGMIAMPSCIAWANRYMAPAGGGKPGSVYRQFTHPETGLTLGYREFYDDDIGSRVAVLECWYGYSTGNTGALKRLVSA